MTRLPVSVVVVSRDRPEALKRCLLGLSQLQYAPFEIVVVADEQGIAAARQLPFHDHLKLKVFERPNISAARNLGLTHAAGEVVAFIDDDAVPEPTWLHHLIAPAEQSDAAAMGGFVRGRNGISFQWKAHSLDRFGAAHDLPVEARRASVFAPPAGRAVKTEGTNMAFRREVLIELDGFDPAFHYFLDETDLNMRLARLGRRTAIVPLAEVHHGFAANAVRRQDRVPHDLFEIGASWAVFQRKHVAKDDRAAHWSRLRDAERRRLIRHMVTGALDPLAVHRLMQGLEEGHTEGLKRSLGAPHLPRQPISAFAPFPARRRASRMMLTRPRDLKEARKEAAARASAGEIITLLNLSPTALYHHVRFSEAGVWEQHGGLFGRSDRDMPLFSYWTRAKRAARESARVTGRRGIGTHDQPIY
jgi:GT2 family glycosyltransferase